MPPIDRLGSVLLHFLWQGLAIAAVYAALRAAAGRATPSLRHLLACAALSAMLSAPLLTWIALAPQPFPARAATLAQWTAPPAYSPAAPIRIVNLAPAPTSNLPWVVAVWLAGASTLSLRLIAGFFFALRLR